ncbi:daptide-type RiPP biosynthesis aminotransferase [Rhizomonospora bruguierae]|uniref:daptide-type RiPP biosynthesis aminotransferase n=1 Tax=Rhizomonospora bruguierae TaxID=1581705 RepID=UPI001BCE1338|nr:daptide-type RiPP biosynthesis aminotransferase [Micromonospora sp. NBRC 107566]
MSALWPALLPPSRHGDDDRCVVAADGVHLTMKDGRRLLCGTSGLWNVNLGYGNAAIADAIAGALREASYLGIFRYENELARQAADVLVELAGARHFSRVQFTTSGGSANDLVMKLVRQYHALRGQTHRRLIVGLAEGYHGLTFGSFALTSDSLGQQIYGVDRSLVRHVPPNDIRALEGLLERQPERVAAVVVEPLLGTGAVPLRAGYLDAVGELRDRYGFLLVADEVATGFGRLGEQFASRAWRKAPDVLITSKGLTNGTTPAAAVLVTDEVFDPFRRADALLAHAETQAGTATTAAAILATAGEMARLDAIAAARRLGSLLDRELAELVAAEPLVASVSGAGCFRALRLLTTDGRPLPQHEVGNVVDAVRTAGAVVHPGPQGIQLIPALTYTERQLGELLTAVRNGLARYAEHRVEAVSCRQ